METVDFCSRWKLREMAKSEIGNNHTNAVFLDGGVRISRRDYERRSGTPWRGEA